MTLIVREHDKHEEHSKLDRGHNEEIDSRKISNMLIEERLPCGRRRRAMARLILLHGRFGNMYPKRAQFAHNARRSPSWVCLAHKFDEVS